MVIVDHPGDCLVFDRSGAGHHRSYVETLSACMGGEALIGSIPKHFWRLLGARRLLLSSADDFWPWALVLISLRSLLGKRTATILVRAECCRELPWKRRPFFWNAQRRRPRLGLMGLTLRGVRALRRGTTTLSILPFYAEPALRHLVSDWIYDPQAWDLEAGRPVPAQARAAVRCPEQLQRGKTLVYAIGQQREIKGSDLMMQLYIDDPALRARYAFVLAGEQHGRVAGLKHAFEAVGGYCVDRFLSDQEILACYHEADVIWTCYRKGYNQSSGIFGRSLQFGLPSIVRRGSYLEAVQAREGWGVAIPGDDAREASAILLGARWQPGRQLAKTAAFKHDSLAKLRGALGL